MEPTAEARRWISEFLGAAADDNLSRAGEAWASLGPALEAIHSTAIPAETQPALHLQIPLINPHVPNPQTSNPE